MKSTTIVPAQIELINGNTKLITGNIDPERAFIPGALGVLVHDPMDGRGPTHRSLKQTFIPWSQIRMIHVTI